MSYNQRVSFWISSLNCSKSLIISPFLFWQCFWNYFSSPSVSLHPFSFQLCTILCRPRIGPQPQSHHWEVKILHLASQQLWSDHTQWLLHNISTTLLCMSSLEHNVQDLLFLSLQQQQQLLLPMSPQSVSMEKLEMGPSVAWWLVAQPTQLAKQKKGKMKR